MLYIIEREKKIAVTRDFVWVNFDKRDFLITIIDFIMKINFKQRIA